MNSFKSNRVRLLVWSCVVAIPIAGWFWFQSVKRYEMEKANPWLREARLRAQQAESLNAAWQNKIATNNPVKAGTNWIRSYAIRSADMTESERQELTGLYADKFRPALDHWANAYPNRLPFDPAAVTLDKFHSTLGSQMFSFMIGDTTLTFVVPRDSSKPAKVGYLMVRQAALDMNRIPTNTTTPNLNVPVTTEQVIQMVQADSGVLFKPNEVIIRPTGKACALEGGAFVDLLPTGADPNNALNYKISMVFDANGKLVNYERDPRF